MTDKPIDQRKVNIDALIDAIKRETEVLADSDIETITVGGLRALIQEIEDQREGIRERDEEIAELEARPLPSGEQTK